MVHWIVVCHFNLHFFLSKLKEFGEKCEGCAKETMLPIAGSINNSLMSHRSLELEGNLLIVAGKR